VIPTAYRVSKRHKVLWATMKFMAANDPVGLRTKKWDRAVIKATVDRRKLMLEHSAADAFGDFFEEQRKAVQRALPSRLRVFQAVKGTVGGLAETYKNVVLDVASSYGPWAASHFGLIAKAPDPFREPMIEWIRQNAATRVAGINQTTREQIRDILAEATEEGDSVQEIARSLDDLYLDDIIPNRSMTIARTEVGNAANFASHEAATQLGVPMKKTWNTLGDAFVRDTHADADGQTVKDEEPFEVGEDQLLWPGDISLGAGPEEVINCRCFLTWEPADEDEDES